jgi:CubicO group peptidase (beta-lactamase class C family)
MLGTMRSRAFAPLLALLVACGSKPPPKPAPPPPPPPTPTVVAEPPPAPTPTARQLAEDTAITTPSGAQLKAPKSWWVTEGDVTILEDPDKEMRVSLLEVTEQDSAKAVAAAWSVVRPDFSRAIRSTDSPPPIRGWDSVTQVDYETKPTEHRAVFALARRYGDKHYVALVGAGEAALDRRGAQLESALWTFAPKGMVEESFKGKTPNELDAKRIAEIDTFVEEARVAMSVPGTAVAIVAGGKVVYEKGFGTRTLGKKEKVTPKTLFLMASITKSMTTMMEAMLVDAGKFAWTTPVTDVLPTFALGDPETTKKLTMAYTSCACTGMPRQDLEFLFEYTGVTPEQRLASMSTMKPTTPFGEVFQYSNLLVAAGGYAAGHAFDPKKPLGLAYDAAMKAKVFDPIGMRSTTFDPAAVARAEHATPHSANFAYEFKAAPLALEQDVVSIRPAGGAWSNLKDMERYVMTEMAGGVTPEGKRVVSEMSLMERRKPNVKVDDTDSYGLGLGVGTYRGLPVVWHSGRGHGTTTLMHMLPEQKFAVVVLSNGFDADAFNLAVHRKVIEEVFDGKDLARARVAYAVKQRKDEVARESARIVRDPDPSWATKLVGTYTNPGLGRVKVTADKKGALWFDAGEWKSALGQKKMTDGTIKACLLDAPLAGSGLAIGEGDGKPTLTLESPQQAYVFMRAEK